MIISPYLALMTAGMIITFSAAKKRDKPDYWLIATGISFFLLGTLLFFKAIY